MGVSGSSLLDENKSKYIKGQAEGVVKEFSLYYRKQFSLAWFSQVEDDLEQQKQKITQLLKQREDSEEGEVLYEESVLYFDDTRKWRERYVVVRANYCLECHNSLQSFVEGVPPQQKLLPTGAKVLTTEDAYMAIVDKCFPDESSAKEDFAPPLTGMPGQFPVYLHLPYRCDSYFCFKEKAKQAAFISILSDCIRHQNLDFLKKKTCEVKAFLKAIQLYRQDKGKYEAWDMLIGSDARVMANLVMEQLLPSLEKDTLPGLKAKKTDKKRVWFATVEAAHILVQEDLFERLSALKEECRMLARQQEVLIHSDMDHILNLRRQLEEKIRDKVAEPAEKLCSESIQPYLGSALEELMEPISSGFQEGHQLSENMMDQVCLDILQGHDNEQLKKTLAAMVRPNLLSCYEKINSLQVKLQHLKERFGFSDITGIIHSAQIDLQELIENAAYTFEQLLNKAIQDNPDDASSAAEKVKHRVLKQYIYDSSTVRKRIFQEALVSITLPFIKKTLVPTCKTELQDLEQTINSDHSSFIHVENVYESILLQILEKEITQVVKEAANLKKHNLFTDKRDLASQSSQSSLPVFEFSQETDLKAKDIIQTVNNGNPDSPVLREKMPYSHTQDSPAGVPQIMMQAEVTSVETGEAKIPVESEMKCADTPQEAEATTAVENIIAAGAPGPTNETTSFSAEGKRSLPAVNTKAKTQYESPEIMVEAPPSGEAPGEVRLSEEWSAELVAFSETSHLAVSVGSESHPSDVESTNDVSTAPDVFEDEANIKKLPICLHDATEDTTSSDKLYSPTQTKAESGTVCVAGDVEAGVSVEVEEMEDTAVSPSAEPAKEDSPSGPGVRPLDCIKEIRDLVVEVIEVEEPAQHYPRVPKED